MCALPQELVVLMMEKLNRWQKTGVSAIKVFFTMDRTFSQKTQNKGASLHSENVKQAIGSLIGCFIQFIGIFCYFLDGDEGGIHSIVPEPKQIITTEEETMLVVRLEATDLNSFSDGWTFGDHFNSFGDFLFHNCFIRSKAHKVVCAQSFTLPSRKKIMNYRETVC